MEEKNLEFWNKYKEVPANALKDFNNGKFKGTDINTIWRMKCLTEKFGMCGVGWYYKPVKLWTEKCDNEDIFAFAEIELFIKVDGEWSQAISGTGGNKMQRYVREGDYLSTSDEAFKMAITDAFGVACKNLGIGADVYWANDKTKYTEYATKQEEKPKQEQVLGGAYVVTGGKYDGKTVEWIYQNDHDACVKYATSGEVPFKIRRNFLKCITEEHKEILEFEVK